MKPGRRKAWTIVALAVAIALGPAPADTHAQQSPQPEPLLEERVEVRLVDLVVRVVDRKGRAIADLRPDEVRVIEGGEEQELAYLVPLASERSGRAPVAGDVPAPLYGAEGKAPTATDEVTVLPPRVQRRVVLAFDPRNSKKHVRDEWKAAAVEWAVGSMQPGDRVAVVAFDSTLRWILEPTAERERVIETLRALDLESHAPNRDRRAEMTRLLDDLYACADAYPAASRPGNVFVTSEAVSCGFSVAKPWAVQWDAEASESLLGLRTLVGELAAIDGPKQVLLFSEGMVSDASRLLATTMVGVYGTDSMNLQEVATRLARDSNAEVERLQRTARSAGVVFHSFDTRSGADRGHFDRTAHPRSQGTATLGINPWAEVYNETNGVVAALANETGGRPYYGTTKLAQKVRDAADRFHGLYSLGYYRSDAATSGRKLRIKVTRKGADVEVSETPRRPWPSHPVALDLAIGATEPGTAPGTHALPVRFEMNLGDLPLRRSGGVHGCQLGLFVQAAAPDGSVVAEAFREWTVAIDENPKDLEATTPVRRSLQVDLPPGSYRLRARASDDRQQIVSRRNVDVTVTAEGEIRAGFEP